MSDFKSDPVMTLETMENVRAALMEDRRSPFGLHGLDPFQIKSLWLISLITEIAEATAALRPFVYNSDVKQLAEQRLGFPPKTDAEYCREGDMLSLLIYNAQSYRRSDLLRAEGFEPFTLEMLTRAHAKGHAIEAAGKRFNVRDVGGNLYAMLPRKRKQHLAPNGQPARVVSTT